MQDYEAKLRTFLGDSADAVDMMLTLDPPKLWAMMVYGEFGPTGSDYKSKKLLLKREDQRALVLAQAMRGYALEGQAFSAPYFRSFVWRCARDHIKPFHRPLMTADAERSRESFRASAGRQCESPSPISNIIPEVSPMRVIPGAAENFLAELKAKRGEGLTN